MSNKTHVKAHQAREHKKEQFSRPARRSSSWATGLIILALLAVIAYLVVGRVREDPTTPTVSAKTLQVAPGLDEVRIPLSEVNSSQAKFFEATLPNNTTTRFFVVRTSDGIHRAALDACQVCFGAHKGYYQDGNVMVCKKCGRRFPISSVGYRATLKTTRFVSIFMVSSEEFQNKLDENRALKTAFEELTPGRQRAYIFYFSAPNNPKLGSQGLKNVCGKFSMERD